VLGFYADRFSVKPACVPPQVAAAHRANVKAGRKPRYPQLHRQRRKTYDAEYDSYN